MKNVSELKVKKLGAKLKKILGECPGTENIECHLTDMQGNRKSVSVTSQELSERGLTSTDGSSVFGKIIPPTESDMVLVPNLETFCLVPWSPNSARVICNVYYPPDKEGVAMLPFEGCGRSILQNVVGKMDRLIRRRWPEKDITEVMAYFAPEVEFLLLPEDYDIDKIHLDPALKNNNYFVSPSLKIDKALKEIIKYLGMVGLKKEKYHTEVATHQYEIGIGYGNAVLIADGVMTTKYIIEKVAEQYGLKASFIPKFNKNVNGSGMHVHQNIAVKCGDEKINLFFDSKKKNGLSDMGRSYIAGLLKYAREITAITNPLPISYKRLVPGCEAPTYISWDWQNRTALCRGHSKGTKKIRVEYRSPDPKCNPYLAFAAMLSAGLSGIEENLKLETSQKRNYYTDHDGIKQLPANLGEALERMNNSKMLRKKMGNYIINFIYKLGKNEWRDYCQAVSSTDIEKYF